MAFLRHLNAVAAVRDLRGFLRQRQKHQLLFAGLAGLITLLLILGFMDGRGLEKKWQRPEIVYVQDWTLDRSLAEIERQNAIDAQAKARRDAEIAALKAKRQAEFKKVDDALTRWGL